MRYDWKEIEDGYFYKLTDSPFHWQTARDQCQKWGGDLAVYGIRTIESRRYTYLHLTWLMFTLNFLLIVCQIVKN